MATLTTNDTNRMEWKEFDELIGVLIKKVAEGADINVIAPLLRSGGIVGSIFAIKTKTVTMLPLQFKYEYATKSINQIISVPEIFNPPGQMNVLLCEGNTSSGSLATKAAAAVKEKYPDAKIYLATLTKVFGGPESLPGIEKIFSGAITDENFIATSEQVKELGLRKGVTIFPWEDAESELKDLNDFNSAKI